MTASRPRLPTRKRVSTMLVIIGCFVASGMLRAAGMAPEVAAQLTSAAVPAPVSVAGSALGSCPDDATLTQLLAAIQERGLQLDAEEARVAERLVLLAAAESRFQEQRAALIVAEERLSATLALASGAADADLDRLTAVYQNMKPKNAAELFNKMDKSFAAGFLGRMNPQSAAAIMSNMLPDAAYAVSLVLASRNMAVPRE